MFFTLQVCWDACLPDRPPNKLDTKTSTCSHKVMDKCILIILLQKFVLKHRLNSAHFPLPISSEQLRKSFHRRQPILAAAFVSEDDQYGVIEENS
jgi:hypothetical protein